MTVTYKQPFKIIVYLDDKAVGTIKKHPTEDKYRYVLHGGAGKGEWLESVEAVKASIENG